MVHDKPTAGWSKNEDGSWPQEFHNHVEKMQREQDEFLRSLPDPPLPPWQQFPDDPAGSMRWKMGVGEDYILYFMQWFSNLEADMREIYSEKNAPPDGWHWIYDRSLRGK